MISVLPESKLYRARSSAQASRARVASRSQDPGSGHRQGSRGPPRNQTSQRSSHRQVNHLENAFWQGSRQA